MKKIVIVDDSEVNLYLLESIFINDTNVEVIIESNSRKALPILREQLPDLIVLDLMMPHLDGFKILEILKSEPKLAKIPIIVITARQDIEAEQRVCEFGVHAYVKKPINLNDIEYMLRRMLNYGGNKLAS